ncbi:MAG: hypothetical protein NWE98_09500 [Candidatus Bathyarchaeota archaeon]|nr:hypothetical protein [Candidatus Bathyarchaeota archaeon]
MKTQPVTWDLTELFPSVTDPKVNQAIAAITAEVDTFEKAYRGKIINLTAEGLLKCLQDLEALDTKISDITLFASLAFSANMTLPETQALHDRVDKLEAAVGKQLAFYPLELGKLVKSKPQLIEDQVLVNYKHMLQRVHRRVEHQLSEVEEQLIIEKDQFGVNAWEELQCKWLNTRLFEITVQGEKKTLSNCEANGLLSNPDRATREMTSEGKFKCRRDNQEYDTREDYEAHCMEEHTSGW